MPCCDPQANNYAENLSYSLDRAREANKIHLDRINEITQYACEMANLLHRHNLFSQLSAPTLLWCAQHRAADELRKEENKYD